MQFGQFALKFAVGRVLRGGAGNRVIAFRLGLEVGKALAHQAQALNQSGALGFHLLHFIAEIVQAQLVGILNLVGLSRSGINQFLCLLAGLLTGGDAGRGGGILRIFLDSGSAGLCLFHNPVRLGTGFAHRLFAVLFKRSAGLIEGAALNAQFGLRLFCALLELLHLLLKASVFEPQHGALVIQRMIALLQSCHTGVEVLFLAGIGFTAARKCRILAGQTLVLCRKRLAVLLQCGVLLHSLFELALRPAQPFFIFITEHLERRTDILRLIAAKACTAHSGLFHKLCHINFRHGIFLPARSWFHLLAL